ncbi:ATP-binding cassette domain-containing protein [Streptomyces sp. NBC_01614]|uniref:ATP-binding cassette domain-containing protein n=1 Tax=Streptomyces sp. NBC_01614 TaxID=2975897 RepID=UPI0038663C8B
MGPNGSGKTTLFNVVSGLIRPDVGRVLLDGRDITDTPPHRRTGLGLSRTFQRLELFDTLTVYENVLAAVERRPGWIPATAKAATEQALERVGLAPVGDQPAHRLSTGSARLLELARAIVAEPRLVLLDEPSSGLDDQETRALGQLLRSLTDEGLAVLLAEHDMALVMDVSTLVHVLDFGHLISSGTPAQITGDPAVRTAYLGPQEPLPHTRNRQRQPNADSVPALELRDVWASYGTIRALSGVSLTLARGQILALLGSNGAGKTSLLKVIAGQLPATRGTVHILGHQVTGAPADALARAGLCLVPDSQAVFPNLTVDENLRMATYRHRSWTEVQEQAFDRFPRLAERRHQLAGTLSGGEQRMLAIARALTPDSAVLLLDEPSAGLSPRILVQVYDAVLQLAQHGTAVLLVEQYAQEVLAIADSAALLVHGHVRRHGPPDMIEQDLVAAYLEGLAQPQFPLRAFRPSPTTDPADGDSP